MSITEKERRERQKAVDWARANVGLEGFKLSPADEERNRKYVSGEWDVAEFIAQGIAHAKSIIARQKP